MAILEPFLKLTLYLLNAGADPVFSGGRFLARDSNQRELWIFEPSRLAIRSRKNQWTSDRKSLFQWFFVHGIPKTLMFD